jgi:predicted CopG family antitoxin
MQKKIKTINVTDDVWDRFKIEAEKQNLSASHLIRLLIEDFLNKKKKSFKLVS